MSGIFNGLQTLVNVIQTIVNGIKMIIQVVLNMVKLLGELIQLLFTTLNNVMILIGTLPPWLTAFATATLGITIVYLLLGRETGK